jgi:hypothetical protein
VSERREVNSSTGSTETAARSAVTGDAADVGAEDRGR